jgi:hypothetical protein
MNSTTVDETMKVSLMHETAQNSSVYVFFPWDLGLAIKGITNSNKPPVCPQLSNVIRIRRIRMFLGPDSHPDTLVTSTGTDPAPDLSIIKLK